MAVRDGGTIINVAHNPEGVAENHPVVLEIGYRPYVLHRPFSTRWILRFQNTGAPPPS